MEGVRYHNNDSALGSLPDLVLAGQDVASKHQSVVNCYVTSVKNKTDLSFSPSSLDMSGNNNYKIHDKEDSIENNTFSVAKTNMSNIRFPDYTVLKEDINGNDTAYNKTVSFTKTDSPNFRINKCPVLDGEEYEIEISDSLQNCQSNQQIPQSTIRLCSDTKNDDDIIVADNQQTPKCTSTSRLTKMVGNWECLPTFHTGAKNVTTGNPNTNKNNLVCKFDSNGEGVSVEYEHDTQCAFGPTHKNGQCNCNTVLGDNPNHVDQTKKIKKMKAQANPRLKKGPSDPPVFHPGTAMVETDDCESDEYNTNILSSSSHFSPRRGDKKHNTVSQQFVSTDDESIKILSLAKHPGRRSAPIFSRRHFGAPAFWTSTDNVTVQESSHSNHPRITKVTGNNALFHKNHDYVATHAIEIGNKQPDGNIINTKRKCWIKDDSKIPPNSFQSDDMEINDIFGSGCRNFPKQQNSCSSHRSSAPILRYFTPDLNSGRTVCLFNDNSDQNNSSYGSIGNNGYNTFNRKQGNISPDMLNQLDQLYIKANNISKNDTNIIRKLEKTPLLNSRSSSSSSSSSLSSTKIKAQNKTAVYKKRWYLLLIFSFYNLIWNAVWSTWGPIAQSAKAVFDWSDGNIAMFTWLGNIPVIIVMFPFAYLMDVKGMRISMIICTGVTLIGTGLRCISTDPNAATWLNYGGQFLNGAAGSVPLSAGAVISGLWFPANQRATATGIATIMGYLGACLSFIIGPLVVPEPGENEHPINTSENSLQFNRLLGNTNNFNETDISGLRTNIMNILYYECGGAVLIFLLVLIYFPSKPVLPPSKSASLPREDYVNGLKMLVRNKQFWLTAVAYGIPIGVYEVWQVILDVILDPRVSQETAGWLDFYGTLGGCFAGLLISRFADLFTRQIKLFLIVFYLLASGSILWFILLVNNVLPFDTVSLYTSIVIIGVCLDGSAPLFFELVIEVSYPSGEGVTSGLLQMIVAGAGTVFLSLMQLETLGKEWINWCFLGCSVLSIPLLVLIKTEFARADMDNETESSISDNDDDDDDESC